MPRMRVSSLIMSRVYIQCFWIHNLIINKPAMKISSILQHNSIHRLLEMANRIWSWSKLQGLLRSSMLSVNYESYYFVLKCECFHHYIIFSLLIKTRRARFFICNLQNIVFPDEYDAKPWFTVWLVISYKTTNDIFPTCLKIFTNFRVIIPLMYLLCLP